MTKQHQPSVTHRQPHFSFMRPGEFVTSIMLIGMTALRFHTAYSMKLSHLKEISWLGGAVLSLLCLIWYVWIRHRRRHLCDDSGEVLIALFIPMTFTIICDQLADNKIHLGWLYDSGLLLLIAFMGYRVWKAPQMAREFASKYDACEAKDFTDQGGL